ncbi:MAG: CbiX/SirB N-terminal domain-containing protein [Opitutaceae bacterium]|nr:CbiX/SirB N-terminal domain-containing protein [Opitutaceae bacterium]
MIAALVDNGSLRPAAHRSLRTLAATLSTRTGTEVHAVSWKYSDRIPPEFLGGSPAWTTAPWLRAEYAAGQRDFVFMPFFVSPQGAVGSRLHREVGELRRHLEGCRISFTPGLAVPGALARIAGLRVRETITANHLLRPALVLVDHGGPSAASAAVRDEIAAGVRRELGHDIRALAVASLGGSRHAHNRPSYAEAFALPGFDRGEVVVAPLFLAPGRHAGPAGDLARIASLAAMRRPSLTCYFTELPGTHPHVVDVLADGLGQALAQHPVRR